VINNCKTHGNYIGDKCPKDPLPAPEENYFAETILLAGIDLAKLHDFSAMVGLEIQKGVATVLKPKVWPHVDYTVVVNEATEIYRRNRMRLLAVDATGVGEPISEMFHARGVITEDIKFGEYVDWTNVYGNRERAPVKHAMMEYGRACLQAQPPKVVFHKKGSEELIQQLKEQELIVSAQDKPTYAHPEAHHDDLAWAFLMALYASRSWLTGQGIHAVWAH
jgi:hypothetical protein